MPVTASAGMAKLNAAGHGALTAPVVGSTATGVCAGMVTEPPEAMSRPRAPP